MCLTRSALLALWLNAALRGSVGPDDVAEVVRGDDPQHLLVDWSAGTTSAMLELPGLVRHESGTAARLALPIAGDLVGLGGPAAFNTRAVDAGEAVVLAGTGKGLVPTVDARTVLWQTAPALAPTPLDPGDEGRQLRRVLVETTSELARLDVASWQPEIPDLLMNVRHRDRLAVPADVPPRAVEDLERAVLCLEIVELALRDEGGSASSHEMGERRRCLADLDRAARRVVVAVCSDSLTAT